METLSQLVWNAHQAILNAPREKDEADREAMRLLELAYARLEGNPHRMAVAEMSGNRLQSELRELREAVWEWYVARGNARLAPCEHEKERLIAADVRLKNLARKPT